MTTLADRKKSGKEIQYLVVVSMYRYEMPTMEISKASIHLRRNTGKVYVQKFNDTGRVCIGA